MSFILSSTLNSFLVIFASKLKFLLRNRLTKNIPVPAPKYKKPAIKTGEILAINNLAAGQLIPNKAAAKRA